MNKIDGQRHQKYQLDSRATSTMHISHAGQLLINLYFGVPVHYIQALAASINMTLNYTYISSIDFVDKLIFDRADTYSFQRGTDFEETLQLTKPEYDRLKVRKEMKNNLTTEEHDRFMELDGLLGYTQYLLSDKGQFHPSSKKISTFNFDSPISDRLVKILKTEIKDIPMWMCAPIYRDAIVFYNKENRIVTTLNICLSCQYIEISKFNYVQADSSTYDLLKNFFVDIGHEVE